jgi:hypothetical protein
MKNEQIVEILANLKQNKDYQYLCKELESLKTQLETFIFDESLSDNARKIFVIKRNDIQSFIALPDNILDQLLDS